MEQKRCRWCQGDALLLKYHDEEWGVFPLHQERDLFEMLTLETMQCGLSWKTVLYKREAMRAAFDNFDPEKIAAYGPQELERCLTAPGVIHSRGKISGMINNALCFLKIAEEFGSFDAYLWAFTGGKVLRGDGETVPPQTPLSEKISADLRRRGFKYTGPVVIYSYLQAVGMVNDHEKDCYLFSPPAQNAARR
ncbi:MAG: DNA-3-methyladenine glycosylase I [Eubacteriales bacterium]|nr:DNA-3-methyladenine glycosylase I [Eubacteriales bacterium]